MKTTNEHLVESFLKENKEVIKDNGFTQQVIYCLPKENHLKCLYLSFQPQIVLL